MSTNETLPAAKRRKPSSEVIGKPSCELLSAARSGLQPRLVPWTMVLVLETGRGRTRARSPLWRERPSIQGDGAVATESCVGVQTLRAMPKKTAKKKNRGGNIIIKKTTTTILLLLRRRRRRRGLCFAGGGGEEEVAGGHEGGEEGGFEVGEGRVDEEVDVAEQSSRLDEDGL